MPVTEAQKRRGAVKEAVESLMNNEIGSLVELFATRKAVGCKQGFKAKLDTEMDNQCYKVRLLAKGYSEKYAWTETSGMDVEHKPLNKLLLNEGFT